MADRADQPSPGPTPASQRRGKIILAVVPYVVLAAVLHQLPDPLVAGSDQSWLHGAIHAAILLGLMTAHAASYALWVAHAPNRILVNEFLTRAWFVLFGLLLVGLVTETGAIFLVLAAPWAVASWCTHYLVLRRQGRYGTSDNVAILGLFLVGLALMGLLCVRALA